MATFGPTQWASQITLAVFVGSLLVDVVVGGRTPWRAAGSDRGSLWLIQALQLLAIGLGLLAKSRVPSADLPLAVWALGIVVMVGGAAMRVWALRTLGAQFRRDVVVETDQTVVTAGPYRWVRHPAYTGSLMIFGGLGLALANWHQCDGARRLAVGGVPVADQGGGGRAAAGPGPDVPRLRARPGAADSARVVTRRFPPPDRY